jgi:hypothetical protein
MRSDALGASKQKKEEKKEEKRREKKTVNPTALFFLFSVPITRPLPDTGFPSVLSSTAPST